MARYAENTEVPIERTRGEIEKLLDRHKCSKFSTGVDRESHRAVVQFHAHNRIIRFEIKLPDRNDKQYRLDRKGWTMTEARIDKAVAQAERQRWRALLLVIKAKLESVENDIATFDEEFMAHILLPNQKTVGQTVLPEIERIYTTGRMGTDRLLTTTEEG